MAHDNLYNPNATQQDLKVHGEVDRTDVATAGRPGSRKAYPQMPLLDQATALFMRMRGLFVGNDADGFRMGDLIVAAGSSTTNLLTAMLNEAEDAGELLQGILSKMDLSRKDVQTIGDWLKKNLNSIVNRYTGSIADSAQELEEFGQAVVSRIDAVKSPIDRLSILYLAYNYAAQAIQTIAVVGDPPRINGPATFISVNAALAANFQYVLPCAMYGRYQVEIVWYTAGTTQVQFNIFGKYSDTAWAALGAVPPGYSQNTKFQTIAGVAFGAPPIGGGAAATPNILVARMQDPDGFNSLCVEMNSINRDANAVVVTGTYRLTGGTA
jgi:hypothetical protein